MNLIDAFLFDREKRVKHQEKLLREYSDNTLVTLKINYPGIEKSNYITDDIVNIIYNEILTYFKKYIVYYEKYKNKEGVICHFSFDKDFVTVKKLMIDIEENHILGRCVDIDVYTMKCNKSIGISRSHLYKAPRKCFICDMEARICSRAQNHSVDDIKKYFEDTYSKYKEHEKKRDILAYNTSQQALKAMISEVSTFPSFGLVSPVSQGSHKDMNYYTFLDSAMAITPYLKEMYKLGYTYNKSYLVFDAIRKVGIVCEDEMFKATKNINTHKGMIFLMGITIAAVAKVNYNGEKLDKIPNTIREMVSNILDDFKDIDKKNNLTHGEKLYLEYGFTGIRGQVKDGLSFLFYNILDKYSDSKLGENELYTQILIELMSIVEDSTVVYRHDIETLKKVQNDAKELLEIGGVYTNEGKNRIIELEKEYIRKNISPGGCADLLAISIFLYNLKKQCLN
ncbi:triphosphoribosyl-dephospho-CoA synthase CitG [Romboutsia ilealis]|uniref:Triphosphoribosyl-dephospho-CoA synthase CitG n=1 Tax=Romboutsia faecis TaxID=2764597 RepID=A0ABR7JP01_9FIRM|nr:triphosphoribosyl-dephospho-CoA synthase CitG [Romboutsia faecis]MBC5996487.1 triphosphoribosyl-dephospho-CoA synthase CitG [Romboutsia faecis]MRN24013.1 triphosphoribosyl-dephospho-CoA synthase CitG [Romboutsia ilealis]